MTRTIPARAAKILLVQCFRMAPFYHAAPAAPKRAIDTIRENAKNAKIFQVGFFCTNDPIAPIDGNQD